MSRKTKYIIVCLSMGSQVAVHLGHSVFLFITFKSNILQTQQNFILYQK